MKKIAVITGASSGIGRRFAETIAQYGQSFDEVWLIARHPEALALPYPVKTVALDLSARESYAAYAALLAEEKPEIALLVNCAGYGKFCATTDLPLAQNLNMMDLNCGAVMAMCQESAPYMKPGARIINIASIAAYQPIPYINVYAATKAFVMYYSRALNRELKKRGITVTAVCPYWTKTKFFDRAVQKDEPRVVKKYVAMYTPEQIVSRAWRDAKRVRDVSKFGFIARGQMILTKLLPHSLVMSIWMKQQELD